MATGGEAATKVGLGAAVAACLALAVADILLLRQNKHLEALASSKVRSERLVPGASVPPLTGFDASGKRLILDYQHETRRTLLLVFSPSCPACRLNWPAWRSLLAAVDPRSLRVALVDSTGALPPTYAKEHGLLNSVVFAQVDPDGWVAYKFALTPQTVVISPGGEVERLWLGVLSGEKVLEVRRELGLRATD